MSEPLHEWLAAWWPVLVAAVVAGGAVVYVGLAWLMAEVHRRVYGTIRFELTPAGEATAVPAAEGVAYASAEAALPSMAGQVDPGWLRGVGFEPLGVVDATCDLGPARMVVWQRRGEPTWFLATAGAVTNTVGFAEGAVQTERFTSIDLVTEVFDGVSLTTGDAPDGISSPQPPGLYAQVLPGLTLPDLWDAHLRGLAVIREIERPTATPRVDLMRAMVEDVRRKDEHLRGKTLWPLRYPYWHFIYRRRARGLTVEQRIARGQIEPLRPLPLG